MIDLGRCSKAGTQKSQMVKHNPFFPLFVFLSECREKMRSLSTKLPLLCKERGGVPWLPEASMLSALSVIRWIFSPSLLFFIFYDKYAFEFFCICDCACIFFCQSTWFVFTCLKGRLNAWFLNIHCVIVLDKVCKVNQSPENRDILK